MTKELERKLYYIKDVEQITGRPRQTLRRWWKKGIFPEPTKLHNSELVWRASTIQDWIDTSVK